MRPDKCGILASVENNEQGQYLRLTLIHEEINNDTIEYFKKWSMLTNTPVLHINNNNWEVL
jgi:hypothetical protein